MDLSSAMQWWEEWQLRVLVLGSLFVQIFLCFSAWVRRLAFPIPVKRVLRVLVWLAYIGGDALAIYALATLFNRHNKHQHQQKRRSDTLEVLWAPVLLIHLGGQHTISAYSLEDNDLWMRYMMTIVSQVTIACYVFYKQWPGSGGERRLLQAAVLLFVVGILKFSQRPWILWSASFNSLLASTTTKMKPSSPHRKCGWIWTIWSLCTSFLPNRPLGTQGGDEEGALSLQDYVEAVTDEAAEAASNPSDITSMTHHTSYICKMFVDLPVPYSGRLTELRSFQRLVIDDGEHAVYPKLQRYFLDTYYLLYSSWRLTASRIGICLRLLMFPLLALAAAVLFSTSRKDGYDKEDVRVTYVLFYGTSVQEFIHILITFVYVPWLAPYGHGGWSSMVYQHSLLSFCARKEQPPMEMKLTARFCSLSEYINKHYFLWQVRRGFSITELVCRHVTNDGWKNYVRDAASYRRFSNLRGQRGMSLSLTRPQHHQLQQRLGRSLDDMRFDESVLLWHIATDLWFHHQSNIPPGQGDDDADVVPRMRSREISNYMIYLLFIRPEMLMPGTRPCLFTDASHEIELSLKDSESSQSDTHIEEGSFARRIMDTVMRRLSSTDADTATKTNGPFIGQACMLADTLITELADEERWQLIQGVWVEMLCYSASRCRGYLHARAIGEGGEYLSYVWLLWFLMGMETLADRHQWPEPPKLEEEEGDA